jgi:hypothetical protein
MRIPFLAMLVFFASASFNYAAPPSPQITDESNVDLRGFGLSFQAPAGWVRAPELSYSQLARFGLTKDGKLIGLLEADTVPNQGRTAKEVAAKIAADQGGTVLDKPSAKSEPAGTVEIQVGSNQQFTCGRVAVFPLRDNFVVIGINTNDPGSLSAAFMTVLASVALAPPKPAVDDLSLRKRPIPLFGSPVLLSLPEPFRPDTVKDAAAQIFLGAHDWPSGHDEASLQGQMIPNKNHAKLLDITNGMASRLRTQLKLESPISFTRVTDNPEAYISTPFSTTGTDIQRVVQMRLDADRIAVLIFRSTAPTPQVRDRYMAMAQEIARAARVSSAYDQGRKSVENLTP